jgi:hemolysin D
MGGNRHVTDSKNLQPHEAQFLPAALALQEARFTCAACCHVVVISFCVLPCCGRVLAVLILSPPHKVKLYPIKAVKLFSLFETTVKAIHVD